MQLINFLRYENGIDTDCMNYMHIIAIYTHKKLHRYTWSNAYYASQICKNKMQLHAHRAYEMVIS